MRRTHNFCEITTLDFSYVVAVKSRMEIFLAFSEYMNFTLYRLHSFRWPLQRACSTWTCHLIYDVYPPAETLERERKNLHLFSKPKQNAISCFIDFLPSLWKHFGIAHLQDPCIIQGQRDYEAVPRILYIGTYIWSWVVLLHKNFLFWWIKKDVIISLKLIIDGGRCLWYKCDFLE